ncbi:manganese ABC transporter permease [Planctomycetia bacterium]|nr:manganese ABC transporter permease [Planctomycetia bacterium]
MSAASLLAADSMWELFSRAVSLRDYNTRVVLAGTTMLGVSGGLVGTFLILRKRALAADVVSHAALPGIALAFLLAERFSPGSGRSTGVLLLGAFVSGLLGMAMTLAIRSWTRIKDDAALAIVLGLFFGVGTALFTVVQKTKTGNAAGLRDFVFGKTASLVAADVWLIGGISVVVIVLCSGVFKELSLLCFDEEFAAARGYRTTLLDGLLTLMAVTVTLIGLQSVGLLLVVALLLIPPTAARFWTNDLKIMSGLAAAIGGASCAGGVVLSAAFPRLAAGAVIVLTGSGLFLVSLVFGKERGLFPRWRSQRQFEQRIGRSDLLRACYELLEPILGANETTQESLTKFEIDELELSGMRQWPAGRFHGLVSTAVREGLLVSMSTDGYQLTSRGAEEARDAVRRHRLWEIYLLTQTDLDPRLVDRGADGIEHVLDPDQLAELERRLDNESPHGVPPSPHPLAITAETP